MTCHSIAALRKLCKSDAPYDSTFTDRADAALKALPDLLEVVELAIKPPCSLCAKWARPDLMPPQIETHHMDCPLARFEP